MSEKELRKVAGHKGTCRHSQTHYMSTPEPCTCGLDEALADDPDVVAVAREFPELQGYLEQKFKFRLTDDGWKWTE